MARTHHHRHYRWFNDPRPHWKQHWYRPSSMKPFTRRYWKARRTAVRILLKKGEEPDPTLTRSSVKWEVA